MPGVGAGQCTGLRLTLASNTISGSAAAAAVLLLVVVDDALRARARDALSQASSCCPGVTPHRERSVSTTVLASCTLLLPPNRVVL